MRVIGAQAHTVGELLEALADTDPSTRIRWSCRDYDGDPTPAAVQIDASALTADIGLEEV